jgi:hypothetical protein
VALFFPLVLRWRWMRRRAWRRLTFCSQRSSIALATAAFISSQGTTRGWALPSWAASRKRARLTLLLFFGAQMVSAIRLNPGMLYPPAASVSGMLAFSSAMVLCGRRLRYSTIGACSFS